MEKLRPKDEGITEINRKNVESLYRAIFFIVKGYHEHNLDVDDIGSKYSLTHTIRALDSKFQFRITKGVYDNCKLFDLKIENAPYITTQERKKINRTLRAEINDITQIEHLNGGVKSFIRILLNPSIDKKLISSPESIKELHLNNTKCLIKMVKQEKDLNHKSNEETIGEYIY